MRKIAAVLLLAAMLASCARLPWRPADTTAAATAQATGATEPAGTAAASHSPRPTGTWPALRTVPPLPTRPQATGNADLPDRKELLAAFQEIAFTSEYPGGSDETGQIRKWAEPVRLAVHGNPSAEDEATLTRAMDGLNALDGFPGITLSAGEANVNIWFVKLDEMDDVIPSYVEGNWGFFTVHFSDGKLSSASIAIATDVTDQAARTHLIYEELLQSTGLMQDLYSYPESIFYGEWTTTPEPLAMDWELLGMLYMQELTPGMAQADAMAALQAKYPE